MCATEVDGDVLFILR